jgi:hypothetical protein
MTVVEIDPLLNQDEIRWNNLLKISFNSSYRNSLEYQLSGSGRKKIKFVFLFSDNGQDNAGAVYSVKSDRFGIIKVADIQYGIIFRTEKELSILPKILYHFIDWAKIMGASYSVISPWFLKTFNGQLSDIYVKVNAIVESFGFRPVIDGQHTYLIDLTKSEDELLALMNRSTRKLVRRGLRSEITTEVYNIVDKEILDSFWDLYHKLSLRKEFASLTKDVFYRRVAGLINKGDALLFCSRFKGRLISATMTSLLGTPAGMYGAIDSDFKNIDDVISPGPLSMWSIFTELKKMDFRSYDMGFCPGPVPDSHHPNYSVWIFKYNFGPDHAQFMPAYGKILRPARGALFEHLRYRRQFEAYE